MTKSSTQADQALGAVIRRRRLNFGLSQKALAERAGIKYQQIQKYEKGSDRVSFSRLMELAQALGSSASVLAKEAEDELAAGNLSGKSGEL